MIFNINLIWFASYKFMISNCRKNWEFHRYWYFVNSYAWGLQVMAGNGVLLQRLQWTLWYFVVILKFNKIQLWAHFIAHPCGKCLWVESLTHVWLNFLVSLYAYSTISNGLMQERRNSLALAAELCLSCTNLSILYTYDPHCNESPLYCMIISHHSVTLLVVYHTNNFIYQAQPYSTQYDSSACVLCCWPKICHSEVGEILDEIKICTHIKCKDFYELKCKEFLVYVFIRCMYICKPNQKL